MAFPDALDAPARTILTGEGGSGASRMKHVIMGDSGRLRRLVPDELDQIQMFPKGWTQSEGNGKTMSKASRMKASSACYQPSRAIESGSTARSL